MKKGRNNSDRASTLQIVLSIGLISISAILLVIAAPANRKEAPQHDRHWFQLKEGGDALGNYPDTSVLLSGDTTVTPDAAPTNTTSINVSTNSNFNGTFAASPTTGVLTVTDAHPAGTYTVTVTAFGSGGTTTKSFMLTVTSTPCGANFTAGFTDAADVIAGSFSQSVAIGDFAGDGKQDLAVANERSNTVSIRLGDGLGGFGGSTEVDASEPVSVAIGDFNGDGKQDLAVANLNSNTVSIRLGDGLGGFSGSTEVSVGSGPYSVAIGDFNGDGKQDLAVANLNSNTVSIRLGDGLGGFSGSTEVSVGSGPFSVAIGDFNGDGKQDLAVANYGSNTVSILLGDGLGGFSGSTNVSVGFGPRSVAIGDFNGDGKQDLATANYGSDTVSIRLGDGLGGFTGSTEVSVGSTPQSVAIGDFNGDGKQDLAVANYGSNTVSILLGDGFGGFGGSTEMSVGVAPYSVGIGDFNGDGKQDLAVANYSGRVSIRLGQCIPVATPPSCQITQSTSQAITSSLVPCHFGSPTTGYGQTENSYWRAFNMATIAGGAEVNVNSVSFGVYSTNNALPVTVRLYTNSGAPFPGGTRGQIGASTITVTSAQAGTVVTTPLLATVPAGTSELVMELFTPNAQADGTLFKVGANMAPETGLSYWSSPCSSCILPIDNHVVFNVYGFCAGGTASPTPTATPSATPTATPCSQIFAENFDSVIAPALPPGWVAQTFCNAPMWLTSTTTPDSGPNDAFISPYDIIDFVGDKRLDTPNMTISGQGAQVSFRNFYNLTNGFEGGVLEVSSPNVNGGAFTDITNAAVGGSFATGGYNAMISTIDWNPIAGRMAWSGNSVDYINTVANLGPNLAGQTIRLRFRMGSSFGGGNAPPGWRIDTISVVAGAGLCTPTPTPIPPPTPTSSPTATATATATATTTSSPSVAPAAQPLNLSTRMRVQTGDNVGIGGFITTGSAPKRVILRGIGPSLTGVGVPDALADPVMELHGPTGFMTIINDNWRDTQEAEIIATGLAPTNNFESAVVVTLNPGLYTTILQGKNNASGVGLVEVYDLDQAAASKLANISTRAFVSTGSNILIAGFILGSNSGDVNLILRGIGPSLTGAGVPNPLANPTLELRDQNGALIRANDDWQDDPAQAAIISEAGLAPTNALESGIAATLPPGQYTAMLAGVNNGTGVGLVEVYDSGTP